MVDDRAGGLGMNEVDFVLLLEETGRVGGPPALGRSTENSRRTIRRPRPRDVRGFHFGRPASIIALCSRLPTLRRAVSRISNARRIDISMTFSGRR
jgi:hypothetical protein